MDRRHFLGSLGGIAAAAQFPALAHAAPGAPESELINISGAELRFGTGLYLFRPKLNPAWLLSEAAALGLNEIRIEYSRDRIERARDFVHYDRRNYHEPRQDVLRLLRQAKFDVLLTLDGFRVDARGRPVDWPRLADGTVDGAAAAADWANYVRFIAEETRDFARAYELWNEPFNTNFDSHFAKKGFGPGGSQAHADAYGAMMLPAARALRRLAPQASILVDGTYWNLERSVMASKPYQELLQTSDFAVVHPYGYKTHFYEPGSGKEKPGLIYEMMQTYPRINPKLGFWFTEYNVSPKDVGRSDKQMPDEVQAKAVLRATLLHMAAGVRHLDIFCMYYPSIPGFTLINEGGKRRQAFDALARLIAACHGGGGAPTAATKLQRLAAPPEACRDLALVRRNGFVYVIWQETPAERFGDTLPAQARAVSLRHAGSRPLKLVSLTDAASGKALAPLKSSGEAGALDLVLPVSDVPLLVELQFA